MPRQISTATGTGDLRGHAGAVSQSGKTLIVESPQAGRLGLDNIGVELARLREAPAGSGGIPSGVTRIVFEEYSGLGKVVGRAYEGLLEGWQNYFGKGVNNELVLENGQIILRIQGRDDIVIELELVRKWDK